MRLDTVPRAQCYRIFPPNPPLRAERLLCGEFDDSEVVPGRSAYVPLGRRVFDRVFRCVGRELCSECILRDICRVVGLEMVPVESRGRVRWGSFIYIWLLRFRRG